MPNFAALRAAVFPFPTKNLRGGGADIRPLVGARVNIRGGSITSVPQFYGNTIM